MISLLSIMHVRRQTLSTGNPAGRRSPGYQTCGFAWSSEWSGSKIEFMRSSYRVRRAKRTKMKWLD